MLKREMPVDSEVEVRLGLLGEPRARMGFYFVAGAGHPPLLAIVAGDPSDHRKSNIPVLLPFDDPNGFEAFEAVLKKTEQKIAEILAKGHHPNGLLK